MTVSDFVTATADKVRHGRWAPRQERFAAVPRTVTLSGCHLWGGHIAGNGYGRLGKSWAHRLAVLFSGRDIPTGMEIDHLCRVPACVNPDHLEVVTRVINVHRGLSMARQIVCAYGHEFTEANTYWYGNPRRRRLCRKCQSRRTREWEQRTKATR